MVLNDGILQVGHDQALGDPSALIVINGGNIRAANATREIPNPVQINGDFTLGRQTNLNGDITLGANVTLIADNPDGPYNTTSALGNVSGPFAFTVREGALPIGTGAIIFNGENTNTGGTIIASGRVDVNFAASLANAPLVVNGGTLNLNNEAQSVTNFSGTGGTVNMLSPHVLTVAQQTAGTYAGVLAGDGSLIKTGPESLTLSGNSASYSGTVQVNQGALLVNGSINGAVEVSGATAVIGGSGQVASIAVQNGGAINPGGAAPGTLSSLSNVSLTAGTQLRLELNDPTLGTGYDQLSLSGTVSLNGATLSLGGTYVTSVGTPSDVFFIILNNGLDAVDGTFAGLPEGSALLSSSGQAFRLTYTADADTSSFTGGNDVALQAIPEPATGAVLITGAGMLLGFRRRRKA
ncbi:MAG: autotransporter-associated beta strand repeat-containing protein [Chthoniobacteraceae bacterium]